MSTPELRLAEDTTVNATVDGELAAAYRAHYRFVARVASRILFRPEDVDDVVQDVFLDAMKGLRSIRDPSAVKSWLATVTVRKSRRLLRLKKFRAFFQRPREDEEGDAVDALVDASASPEVIAELRHVARALAPLPTNVRIAWTLRHLDGEKLEDVAAACECSLATVKRWIQKAEDAVSAALAEERAP